MALSVKPALSEPPRPLAGMPPYGDRTFLPERDPFEDAPERLPVRQARIHYGLDWPGTATKKIDMSP